MNFVSLGLLALCALGEIPRFLAHSTECPSQSLRNAAADYPQCTILPTCDGISCVFGTLDAVMVVNKCTDPLKIEVTVTVDIDNNTYAFASTFTSSGKQMLGNMTIELTTSRNASYVDVKVVSGGNDIIPFVSVPLNQSDCMCQSMDNVIENINSPVETTCIKNADCTGIECNINIDEVGQIVLETDFEICQEPPGILLLIRNEDGVPLYDHYFTGSSSEVIVLSPNLQVDLYVSIVPHNYSMTVQGIIAVDDQIYDFFPEQQIIVDKSICITSAPTDAPPSDQPISDETCAAMKGIAGSPVLIALDVACNVTALCDALVCNVVGYKLYVQLLPCEQLPSFFIQVNDSEGIIYETVLNGSSTSIPLEEIGTLVFTISHKPGAVGLKVSLITEFFGQKPVVVLPEKDIPIDQCRCPNITTCTTEHVSTLAPPTSGSVSSQTCDTINWLVQSLSSCRGIPGGCDAFICNTFIGYKIYVQVLPCLEPPAFRIQVSKTTSSGKSLPTIFDGILTDSTIIPLPDQGDSLQITIAPTADYDYISIMIMLNYSVPNANPTVVVPLTQIPLGRCSCPNVACPSPSSTSLPSSSGLSVDTIIAITIPIAIVLIIALLASVVTMAIIVVRKKRRTSNYPFQRLTFVGAQDNDEEDSDDDAGKKSCRETGEENMQEDA